MKLHPGLSQVMGSGWRGEKRIEERRERTEKREKRREEKATPTISAPSVCLVQKRYLFLPVVYGLLPQIKQLLVYRFLEYYPFLDDTELGHIIAGYLA